MSSRSTLSTFRWYHSWWSHNTHSSRMWCSRGIVGAWYETSTNKMDSWRNSLSDSSINPLSPLWSNPIAVSRSSTQWSTWWDYWIVGVVPHPIWFRGEFKNSLQTTQTNPSRRCGNYWWPQDSSHDEPKYHTIIWWVGTSGSFFSMILGIYHHTIILMRHWVLIWSLLVRSYNENSMN